MYIAYYDFICNVMNLHLLLYIFLLAWVSVWVPWEGVLGPLGRPVGACVHFSGDFANSQICRIVGPLMWQIFLVAWVLVWGGSGCFGPPWVPNLAPKVTPRAILFVPLLNAVKEESSNVCPENAEKHIGI